MELRLIRLLLGFLFAATVIGEPDLSQAARKGDSPAQVLCKALKIRCSAKISRAKPSRRTATAKKKRSPPKPAVASQSTPKAKVATSASKPKAKVATSASKPKAKVVASPSTPKAKIVASPSTPKAKIATVQKHLVAPRLLPRPKQKPKIEPVKLSRSVPPENPQNVPPPPENTAVPPPLSPAPLTQTSSCRTELAELDIDFTIPDRVEGIGDCRVVDPVKLRAIETSRGRVEFPGEPIFNCPFARQFGVWVSDIAIPVVKDLSSAGLSSLSTGPGYECRNRNGDSSSKISEHAFGNAVDIDGITLSNSTRIEISSVTDKQDPHHRMLMALRISACGYFTTVLGPGANAAHASHFHFDLGRHGRSGSYRICE